MALPPGLETLANNALDYLVTQMAANQDDYLTNNGRFFQGVRTPKPTPSGGATAVPDLTLKPTDQDEDWSPFINNTARPISMKVNVHETPSGWGYSCIGMIKSGGDTYIKSVGVGEGGETFDWSVLNEGAP